MDWCLFLLRYVYACGSMVFLIYTTYAVGDPAFGRAVLYLLWWFGFALYERKTEPQTQWGYHAAAGLKAFEGGTAERVSFMGSLSSYSPVGRKKTMNRW